MAERGEPGCQVRAVPWKRGGRPAGGGRGALPGDIGKLLGTGLRAGSGCGAMALTSTQCSAQLVHLSLSQQEAGAEGYFPSFRTQWSTHLCARHHSGPWKYTGGRAPREFLIWGRGRGWSFSSSFPSSFSSSASSLVGFTSPSIYLGGAFSIAKYFPFILLLHPQNNCGVSSIAPIF